MSAPSLSARAGLLAEALAAALIHEVEREWRGSRLHLAGLTRPAASGWTAGPHDPRPVSARQGQAMLGGLFTFAGETLDIGPGGDPWGRASPSERFARALHRFDWLPQLMAAGEDGVADALRLTQAWIKGFGRWNGFAWRPDILERRVFALACAGRAMTAGGDTGGLAQSLARQARHLAQVADGPRAAERLNAATLAGVALAGPAGERLMGRGLRRLEAALEQTVSEGGRRSRSPEAGLGLLLDLLALEDGLSQRGAAPPDAVLAAIERLTGGLRVLALSDGGLPALQGGGPATPELVAAARVHDQPSELAVAPPRETRAAGYERLESAGLTVVADAASPAQRPWNDGACGQPMAIEVAAGRDRLITSSGWSAEAGGPQALRLAAGASTATIGLRDVGQPLSGFAARALGARLVGGVTHVRAHRRETEAGVWLDMAHDGWRPATGLTHERRLFLDKGAQELRGEDRFAPIENAKPVSTPIAIYFHLHPDVTASLARDQRSVLLRGPSAIGWWLRNDAGEVVIEASVCLEDGRARRTQMVVMRGRLRADRGGRVRWKLALAEPGMEPATTGS